MARVDSGHETVTSEDEDDSVTPKYSPVSSISPQEMSHSTESCQDCNTLRRRYPITSEKDLFSEVPCHHVNVNKGKSISNITEHPHEWNQHNLHNLHPPRLTDNPNMNGKSILRPIAFKATDITCRSVSGLLRKPALERHNSETGLKRNSNIRLSLELSHDCLPYNQSIVNNGGTTPLDANRFGGSLSSVLHSVSPSYGEFQTKRVGSHLSLPLTNNWESHDGINSSPTTAFHLDSTSNISKGISTPTLNWDSEMKSLQAIYESNLKSAQQRVIKLEQSLASSSCQLQQERRQFRSQIEENLRRVQQTERLNSTLRQDVDNLRAQLEDAEWSLCHRIGEMSLLKAQLKDSQGDQATRCHELVQLRTTLKDLAAEASSARSKLAQCTLSYRSKERENMILRQTLLQEEKRCRDIVDENNILRKKLKDLDLKFTTEMNKWEKERIKWSEEQKCVLRYQKTLQQNYVLAMQRIDNMVIDKSKDQINNKK